MLIKDLKDIIHTHSEDKDLIISILEKEKLLSLLKMRNHELLLEKKEALRLQDNSVYTEKTSSNLFTHILYTKKNKEKDNSEKQKINLSVIYNLIQNTFDYILINDSSSIGEMQEYLPSINSMPIKSSKALSQMKIIELCYTSLFYYKETHIQGKEALYKKLLEEIDLNHKRTKADKYKKEEELKNLELYKKLQAKRDRIIFRPRFQNDYSSLVYIEKLKREAKKKTKNVKKEIDIFDFLYDIDENKEEDKK